MSPKRAIVIPSILLLMSIFQYGHSLTLTLTDLENWKKQMKAELKSEVKDEIFLELSETEEIKRISKEIHEVTKNKEEIITVVQDHGIKLGSLQEFTEKFQETETHIENLGKELNKTISLIGNLEVTQNETDLITKRHADLITELQSGIKDLEVKNNETHESIKIAFDQQVANNDQLYELENDLNGIVVYQNETKLVILNHANQLLVQLETNIDKLEIEQKETKAYIKSFHPTAKGTLQSILKTDLNAACKKM